MSASQSVVPHAQFAGLADVPSVMAQVGEGLHRSLLDVSQKNPVPDQQSTEPHLQTPSFSEAPLPSEQVVAWLQMLEEDAQTSPVAEVQAPEAPQTQGAGLAVAPSPWAQAGNKHTENPDCVSDGSELHVIASPALTLTVAGPLVPEYCVPPTVSLS